MSKLKSSVIVLCLTLIMVSTPLSANEPLRPHISAMRFSSINLGCIGVSVGPFDGRVGAGALFNDKNTRVIELFTLLSAVKPVNKTLDYQFGAYIQALLGKISGQSILAGNEIGVYMGGIYHLDPMVSINFGWIPVAFLAAKTAYSEEHSTELGRGVTMGITLML